MQIMHIPKTGDFGTIVFRDQYGSVFSLVIKFLRLISFSSWIFKVKKKY